MIIWLIGMSGSGKTTLGELLVKKLRSQYNNIVFLDGDIMRKLWGDSPGHDIAGRHINAQRISHLCKFLDTQNIHVVAAVLSIFPEWQRWNREHFSSYFEIFLDIGMDTLKKRDTKNLYKQAEKGLLCNVVGIDIKFPTPENPDMIVTEEMQKNSPELVVNYIMEQLPKNLEQKE